MMTARLLRIGISVVIVVAVSFFWKLTGRSDEKEVSHPTVMLNKGSEHPADVEIKSVQGAISSADSFSKEKYFDLIAEFRNASELRVFSEKAKLHPEKGGIYYAKLAKLRCLTVLDLTGQLDKLPAVKPEDLYRQQEALRGLQNLCASFNAYEVEPKEVLMETVGGNASLDPLLAIRNRLAKAEGNEERRAPLLDLMAARDPALIRSMLILSTEQGHYFDGEYYPLGSSSNGVREALGLLACDLGDRCDSSDFEVMYSCALQGRCVPDRASLIELQLRDRGDSQITLNDVKRLKDRIQSALNSRNVDAFVPK